MKEAIKRLKDLLEWSDRLGSDELDEIATIIGILKNTDEKYTLKEMEESFISGGKLARNIENQDFSELIEEINKRKNN